MKRLMVCAIALGVTLTGGIAMAAPGDPDPGFGSAGVVTGGLLDTFGPLTVDAAQRVVVLGTTGTGAAIARYTPTGAPDTTFSGDGRVDLGLPGDRFTLLDVRTLAGGSTVATGIYWTASVPFSTVFFAAKVSETGDLVGGYGTAGVGSIDIYYTYTGAGAAIAPDGAVTLSMIFGGIPPHGGFLQFDANGAEYVGAEEALYDTSTIPAGCTPVGYTPGPAVRPDAAQVIYVGNALISCGSDMVGRVVLTSQNIATGAVNWSVMLPATETADVGVAVAMVGSDVVFATDAGGTIHVHRYTTSGAVLPGWGAGGVAALPAGFGNIGSITALAGGKVGIVSGTSEATPPTSIHIDRLLSNGAVDSGFPRVTTALGGAQTSSDIAGSTDGGVLATTQTATTGALRRYQGGTVSALAPLTPGRLMDSREGQSTVDGLFAGIGVRAASSITELQVGGRGGVPMDAAAVVLNVTVTGAQGSGFITVFPCGEALPTASNLNFVAGDTVPNAVVVKLGAGGRVCLFAAESATHLIADTNGYFPAGSGFAPLTPGRLMDSREGQSTVDGLFAGIGVRAASSITELQVGGRGGVPMDAAAVVLNVTVTGAQGSGFITVFPCGEALPTASNLNFVAGDTVPNAVVVKLGAGGRVCLFAAESATHLIADTNGYFPA